MYVLYTTRSADSNRASTLVWHIILRGMELATQSPSTFDVTIIRIITVSFTGSRAKLLPYTNFYVEVLTQYRIKLLHVEVLTNVRIKLLHIEVLTIFPDKTSTLTELIKKSPPPES